MARKTDDEADRTFGIHALLAFGAVLLAAVPFALLVVAVRSSSGPVLRLDHTTSNVLHDYAVRHPAFTTAMRAVSNVDAVVWWVVLIPVAGWLLYRQCNRLAAFVAVTAIGSTLLNRAIKIVVGRSRPVLDHPVATAAGKSFPSGHTQSAVAGCAILLLVFLPSIRRPLRPGAVGAAAGAVALIGFSRIALGVHYLSDVLGAIVVGAAWVLAMTAVFSAWRRDPGGTPADLTEDLQEP